MLDVFKEVIKILFEIILGVIFGLVLYYIALGAIYFFNDTTVYHTYKFITNLYYKNNKDIITYYGDFGVAFPAFILSFIFFAMGFYLLSLAFKNVDKKEIEQIFSKTTTVLLKIKYILLLLFVLTFFLSIFVAIPVFALFSGIAFIYDRYEFYDNQIKIYKLWDNANIFKIEYIKYEDVDSLYFDFEAKYTGTTRSEAKDIRQDKHIYILITLKYKNQKEVYIANDDIIHALYKKEQIIKLINLFKTKNIKINFKKTKKEVFEMVLDNYHFNNDKEFILNNLNEIFKTYENS